MYALMYKLIYFQGTNISAGENLCKAFNVTPEDLKFKWESLTYKNTLTHSELPTQFSMESVAELKALLQTELSNAAAKRKNARNAPVAAKRSSQLPMFGNKNQARMGPALTPGQTVVKSEYMAVDLSGPGVAGPSNVRFEGPRNDASSKKQRACEHLLFFCRRILKTRSADRYMYEKVVERGIGELVSGLCFSSCNLQLSSALDKQIDIFSDLICEHYKIDPELGDPAQTTDVRYLSTFLSLLRIHFESRMMSLLWGG